MSVKRKLHLQYIGSGYVDVGICAPWDYRSKEVTTRISDVTCKLCQKLISDGKRRGSQIRGSYRALGAPSLL